VEVDDHRERGEQGPADGAPADDRSMRALVERSGLGRAGEEGEEDRAAQRGPEDSPLS
jgi:hypothetical protein